MQIQKLSIRFAALLAIFAVTIAMTATHAAAQTEKVLHSFNYTATNKGPINPYAGLIFDADGNLYGTTLNGGPNDLQGGTVFELSRMCGGWTEKTLHVFGNGKDGRNPYAGVISDKDGNLYGTTYSGGVYGQVRFLSYRAHRTRAGRKRSCITLAAVTTELIQLPA